MLTDLRLALRSLARSPGFAVVAILTLTLGLAANITVFGMLNEFLFRPLPVRDPSQLAFIMQRNPQIASMPFPLSYPDYLDIRERLVAGAGAAPATDPVFSGLIAYVAHPANVGVDEQLAERAWVHEVSDNFFEVLGVAPAAGRLLLPGEGVTRNADPIAVLAHDYWQRRFTGDPAIIGRPIKINGVPFIVVGIAAEHFGGAEAMTRAHVFVPAMMADQLRPKAIGAIAARGNTGYLLMGRLQSGVDVATAAGAVDTALQSLIATYPNEHPPATAVLVRESAGRPSPYVAQYSAPALFALMALAFLVLLVAIANIANLLYARATEAERALAIRSSLGASRWRLIRQMLAESVVLAVAAAIVGTYVSDFFGLALQQITVSADNPPPAEYGRDWRPLAFTAIAALVAGIVTGLFPALRATRLQVLPLLKESTPTLTRSRHPLRSLLVAGQIALSCIVLVCAGLAVRSLQRLKHLDLGFRPENVLLATVDLEMQRYTPAQMEQFQRALLDEVRALPGVLDAGIARAVPFDRGVGLRADIGAEGQAALDLKNLYPIASAPVTPRYLETIGVPLRAGRAFTENDDAQAPPVAIINTAVARHFWPGQEAVGKRLAFQGGQKLVEVVGVIGELRYFMMTDRDRPIVFLPLAQDLTGDNTLALHTQNDPLLLGPVIEQIVRRLDASLPVHNVRTLEEQITGSPLGLMPLRVGVIVAATQGALVLLLAVMGLYGLVSFAVARRTREIGIRIALGASARDVVYLVTRPSLVLTTIGLVVGLLIGAAATLPLSVLLYGAKPLDPLVFAGVVGLVILVTVLATWLPARRAMRVNPIEALRTE